jgi:hypothetical protein
MFWGIETEDRVYKSQGVPDSEGLPCALYYPETGHTKDGLSAASTG